VINFGKNSYRKFSLRIANENQSFISDIRYEIVFICCSFDKFTVNRFSVARLAVGRNASNEFRTNTAHTPKSSFKMLCTEPHDTQIVLATRPMHGRQSDRIENFALCFPVTPDRFRNVQTTFV